VTKVEAESCVDQVMDQLDEGIDEALADVTVYVVDGRDDVELKEAIRQAGMSSANIARDFRGLYLGTTATPAIAGDPLPSIPSGSIVVNCQALATLAEVRDTLAHEIGHALGMTEEEVENLGLG
jgi:predicted Zn-dependent protease with MMP-like domain